MTGVYADEKSPSPPDGATSRRILLISYHFGADGATGGFRWRSMAEHLSAQGWQTDVITAPTDGAGLAAERYPSRLGGLVEVPTPAWGSFLTRVIAWARIRRHAAPSVAPVGVAETGPVNPDAVTLWTPPSSRSRFSRALMLVEGLATLIGEWSWAWAAARVAERQCRGLKPDVLIVSTPPHVTSVAAIRLARRLGVPGVVDFRDPWVLGFEERMRFNDDDLQLAVWRRSELLVLREATLVVHNTTRALQVVTEALGERRRARHVAVPNGYEDGYVAAPPDANVFRISFTGWLHPVMDVRVLLSAFGRFRARHALATGELEIVFMGTAPDFGDVPLRGLAAAYGLEDVFTLRARGSRAEALRMQESSSVLCAMDYLHPMAVPMKFYDYAQMCGTMLLIGTRPSALADAAARIDLPVFCLDEPERIDTFLDEALVRWRNRSMNQPMDRDGLFSRSRQAEALSGELRALADGRLIAGSSSGSGETLSG